MGSSSTVILRCLVFTKKQLLAIKTVWAVFYKDLGFLYSLSYHLLEWLSFYCNNSFNKWNKLLPDSFSCSVVVWCAGRDLLALGKGLSGLGASAFLVLLAGRAFEEVGMLQVMLQISRCVWHLWFVSSASALRTLMLHFNRINFVLQGGTESCCPGKAYFMQKLQDCCSTAMPHIAENVFS